MAEKDVVEGERCGGAVGEVGDCEGRGGAAVFVKEEEIAEPGRVCGLYQIWQNECPAIQAYRRGDQKAYFFCES